MGGIGIGAVGAVLSVSWIPVVGWIAGGVIAVAAIGLAIYEIASGPKCSDSLGSDLSQWKFYHRQVRFNSHHAILSSSVLVCGEGEILTPYVSEAATQKNSICYWMYE